MRWNTTTVRQALAVLPSGDNGLFGRALRFFQIRPLHANRRLVQEAFEHTLDDRRRIEIELDVSELAIKEAAEAEDPPGTDKVEATRLEAR